MNGQQQLLAQQAPPVPQNGPVMYGSGIVFRGNVYPVLIDGVPIQPPVSAHQAAVQQRMQMQPMQQSAGDHQTSMQPQMQMQQRLEETHPQQASPKSLPPRCSYQRSEAPRTLCRAPTAAAAPSMSQQQQRPLNNSQQLQLRQQPQLSPMGGGPYSSFNFNNNPQPRAGGDFFGSWDGYCMWQPTDMSKPYTIGWN